MKTIRWIIAVALLVNVACSEKSDTEAGQTGVARVSLTNAPTDARCLQITVVGVRTLQRNFDLSPGDTSTLMLRGLPLGSDTFTGLAYGTFCSSVAANAAATWQSDSVVASISLQSVANVSLIMRRMGGQANVSVDFQGEDDSGVARPSYTITDLGAPLGDTIIIPVDINNSNEVVGGSGSSAQNHAFIWRNGSIQTLAGCNDWNQSAWTINNVGVVVGTCGSARSSTTIVWQNGVPTTIPIYYPWDINDDGWIAAGNDCGPPYRACVYDGVSATDFSLGGCAGSRGINNSGTVVGISQVPPNNNEHPFVSYNRGKAQDLGTLGGANGEAWEINEAGDIVGRAQSADGTWHLVMWPGGNNITDLGVLNFSSNGAACGGNTGCGARMSINSSRRIVANNNGHASLWVPPGTMYDLNDLVPADSGWVLQVANTINDRNFIIGYGTIYGQTHGFLLTPVDAATGGSPSTLLLQNSGNGHWYQRFDQSRTWHNARDFCAGQGGYLVTITSQAENDFVYKHILATTPYDYGWLGATDEVFEGTWEWVTGEPFAWTNWDGGGPEPNNLGNEDFLEMFIKQQSTGMWNDTGEAVGTDRKEGACCCGLQCSTGPEPVSTVCEWESKP